MLSLTGRHINTKISAVIPESHGRIQLFTRVDDHDT
jgi:hypothetical protein